MTAIESYHLTVTVWLTDRGKLSYCRVLRARGALGGVASLAHVSTQRKGEAVGIHRRILIIFVFGIL